MGSYGLEVAFVDRVARIHVHSSKFRLVGYCFDSWPGLYSSSTVIMSECLGYIALSIRATNPVAGFSCGGVNEASDQGDGKSICARTSRELA
jgi:hypothetical protein